MDPTWFFVGPLGTAGEPQVLSIIRYRYMIYIYICTYNYICICIYIYMIYISPWKKIQSLAIGAIVSWPAQHNLGLSNDGLREALAAEQSTAGESLAQPRWFWVELGTGNGDEKWWFNGILWWFTGDLMGFYGDFMVIYWNLLVI